MLRATIHVAASADYWPLNRAIRATRREWYLRVRGAHADDVRVAAERVRAALTTTDHIGRKELDELAGAESSYVGLFADLVRVPPSGTWERRRADRFAAGRAVGRTGTRSRRRRGDGAPRGPLPPGLRPGDGQRDRQLGRDEGRRGVTGAATHGARPPPRRGRQGARRPARPRHPAGDDAAAAPLPRSLGGAAARPRPAGRAPRARTTGPASSAPRPRSRSPRSSSTASSPGRGATSTARSRSRPGARCDRTTATPSRPRRPPSRPGTADRDRSTAWGPSRWGSMRGMAVLIDAIRRRIPPPMVWSSSFNRFTLATVLSGIADALVAVSLAGSLFFSLSPEASREQVLLYLLINMAPFALLAPLVGPVIDRFRLGHRWISVILFALRAACAAALAFTLLDLTLYFFALALLICGKAFGVVRQALVPELVDESDQLVAANSRLARLNVISGAVGAAMGGLVLAITHAPGCDPRPGVRVLQPGRRGDADAAEHHATRGPHAGRRVRGAARPDDRRHGLGVHGHPRRRRVLRVRSRLRAPPHQRADVDVRRGDRRLWHRHLRRQLDRPAAAPSVRRGPADGRRPGRPRRRARLRRPRTVAPDRDPGVARAGRGRRRRPPGVRRDGADPRADGDPRAGRSPGSRRGSSSVGSAGPSRRQRSPSRSVTASSCWPCCCCPRRCST